MDDITETKLPLAPPAPAECKPLLLLVDDMPQNLQVLTSHLGRDYDLAITTQGRQTLDMALAHPPDLILLDVMMPDLDGFEVCKALKANVKTATIPVIFLTARVDVDSVVKGFELGAVDYVTKPFRAAELRARVKTHVQLHQLKRFLSMCSYCHKIRNEKDEWERVDFYLYRKAGTLFSHGICPACRDHLLMDVDRRS